MKNLLTLAMVLGLSLVLVACGGQQASESAPATPAPSEEANAVVEEAAEAAEGSGAKMEEAVEEAAPAAEEAPAESPAAAGDDLNGLVGTSWAFEDGTSITVKDSETAVIKGGVVALIAPDGLDAKLSFEDGNVTISAMGQSRTGTWDGETLEIDGNAATKQ